MAGKQGRWAAGPGRGQPAGKLGAQGASGNATSGHGAPQQADTKRYPVAAAASSAELAKGKPNVPVRGDIKSRGSNVEEDTGTVEVTSLEEITNVSATSSRGTRVVRRLPLPAPSDPGEDEDEYTDVQISKSVPPELLELSESAESLELSESTELSESMTMASTSVARGRGARVKAPRGRKSRSIPQEPTQTALDPVVPAGEVTRTITEATATDITSSDAPPKLAKVPRPAKLPTLPTVRAAPARAARAAPAAPAPAAPAPAAAMVEAASSGAVDVATAEDPAAPAEAEGADDLGGSESEMLGAMALDLPVSSGRRWLAAPAVVALGVGLYFVMGALFSGPTKKAASLAQSSAESVSEAPRAVEQMQPAPEEVNREVGAGAEAQPAEETQPTEEVQPAEEAEALEPEMVFKPEEAAADPETGSLTSASKETASVPAVAIDQERMNRESSRREAARRAQTSKSETPADKRENASPGGKQVAQQFYKKGISAFVGGQLAAAEREFQSALKADPGFALALRGLGLVYERQGQKSKAVGAFRRYLKRSPRAKDADKVNERITRLGG